MNGAGGCCFFWAVNALWHFSEQLPVCCQAQLDITGKLWKQAGEAVPVGMLGKLKAVSLAGILRYRVDFQGMEYQGGDDEFFDLDDY